MENFSLDPPAYYMPQGLFEYLLIVSPCEDVYNKVMEEKQYFFRNYNQQIAIKTKPHITITNFLAWDNMEDTIVRWLQRIVQEQKRFELSLNNYSGFPSHTVFLRVQDGTILKEMATRVKVIAPYIKQNDCPPAKFTNYPHLSIARRLPAEVYDVAIKDYAAKEFYASFEVRELILLRRKHQYDACKEAAIFRLQPTECKN